MPARSLADWLSHLETLHPENIELGLERVGAVAARLGLDKPEPTVVTVAGTNGKGSTTALLEAMATAAGKRVGVYTSPHLLRYNERVRIDGCPVKDEALLDAFEIVEAARGTTPLTYFEFGTLAALAVFAAHPLDLLVLEVGLGGRLDAVNIVDPDIAIITSISLDHERWLGSDREAIGAEKAGILRPGVPAFIADSDPPGTVLSALERLDCRAEFYRATEVAAFPDSPLRPENIFAAVGAARSLGFGPAPEALAALLRDLVVPGRLQRVHHDGIAVTLDVAHNPAAVQNLVSWLGREPPCTRVALFSALSDKDIHAMIQPCRGVFEHWYVAGLPGVARALAVEELAGAIERAGLPLAAACGSVADAWARIRAEQPRAAVVVFGSFYTVAGFMELLGEGHEQA